MEACKLAESSARSGHWPCLKLSCVRMKRSDLGRRRMQFDLQLFGFRHWALENRVLAPNGANETTQCGAGEISVSPLCSVAPVRPDSWQHPPHGRRCSHIRPGVAGTPRKRGPASLQAESLPNWHLVPARLAETATTRRWCPGFPSKQKTGCSILKLMTEAKRRK